MGLIEGCPDGWVLGLEDGKFVGFIEGCPDGWELGLEDGEFVGSKDGCLEGCNEGSVEGKFVGCIEGQPQKQTYFSKYDTQSECASTKITVKKVAENREMWVKKRGPKPASGGGSVEDFVNESGMTSRKVTLMIRYVLEISYLGQPYDILSTPS